MSVNEVPRLNLAPKRRKPLSLWNPLDYTQLLWWVFVFPQALRWHVESFGEERDFNDCKTWTERFQWFGESKVNSNFLLQGVIIAVLVPALINVVVYYYRVYIPDLFGIFLGVAGGVLIGMGLCLPFGAAAGVAGGVASGVALGVVGGISGSTTGVALAGVLLGLLLGVVLGVVGGVTFGVAGGVSFGLAGCLAGSVAFGIAGGVAGGIAFGITFGAALGAATLRPEVWLVAAVSRCLFRGHLTSFGSATSTPLPGLTQQISSWLERDWLVALHNLNELLAYTQQSFPIVKAVNSSLAKLPGDVLLLRVSQLAEDPFDWDLIRYASASLTNELRSQLIEGIVYLPGSWKRRMKFHFSTRLRLNTSARAAAAGFWYLHQNQPHRAARAFSHVRHLPHGSEMHHLANCLSAAQDVEQLNDNLLSDRLYIPRTALLRSDTWPTISLFRSIVDDAHIILQSYSRYSRSLALNRALGKITEILSSADRIPLAERELVILITKSWREKLLAVATDIGEVNRTHLIRNPYVAGDPVDASLFVGRTEIFKQLVELWLNSNQLQSIVLFGHRRMGKTSFLRNLPYRLKDNVQFVYVNLLSLGAVSDGVGEVLIALSDAISHQLSIEPPEDEKLIQLPYPTFRRFIGVVSRKMKSKQSLIIALDEFEKLEDLILSDRLSPDFLGFLRSLLQEYPKIAFAFAGLHTLEEMTEDYFNPLFASVLPIHVGFFSIDETRELLANPAEDFNLDYTSGTLDEIYRLTAGQPYLTQLIGFQLVRHFNHQVFEQGKNRDHIFTPQDLDTVINQADFFAKGRYYFTGVWNQAVQDAPGQHEILKMLARQAKGRSLSDICRESELQEAQIRKALKTLKRHDVVSETEGNWIIIVPLFRQWLLNHVI